MAEVDGPMARLPAPGRGVRWAQGVLALAALVLSASLLSESIAGAGLPGCGGDAPGGCHDALASHWAQWFGVPVSAFAVVLYACVLLALFQVGRRGSVRLVAGAWWVLLACTVSAAAAAAWFIGVMALDLGSLCRYCLGAHLCGLGLAALVWATAPIRHVWQLARLDRIGPGMAACAAAAGLVGAAALIVGQLLHTPSTLVVQRVEPIGPRDLPADMPSESGSSAEGQRPSWSAPAGPRGAAVGARPGTGSASQGPPAPGIGPAAPARSSPSDPRQALSDPDRQVFLLGGRIMVKPHEQPVMGKPDAPYVLLSLFDYTCPHCRELHTHLAASLERYGDQLGIVAAAVPLNALCNKNILHTHETHRDACALALVALQVWQCDPDRFEAFDAWMFESDIVPTPEEAAAYAVGLVGEDAYERAKRSPRPRRQIRHNVTLYQRLPRRNLPVLIGKELLIFGKPASTDELCRQIEDDLGLKAPDG